MSQTKVTALSGNEIYCMQLKGLRPAGVVVGNSVHSMGMLGGLTSAFRGALGGEAAAVTEMIHNGRQSAFKRMVDEAVEMGVQGIVGVSSELRGLAGNSEFLFVGSAVTGGGSRHFTSAGDAQELYCHMDAGYQPYHFVFGNIAYAVGAVRGLTGTLKTMMRGEIKEFSDIFNATRHHALERLVGEASKAGANAVVGVRTNILEFSGFHEMYMTGTAAHNPNLPSARDGKPVTSDLTGEELWAMTSLGYVPVKLLISTSVYSLGAIGGLKTMFKGLMKGEISDLTTMIYDARENVFGRLQSEAAAIGAEEVVGIKTYIVELGSALVEMVAIGTAVRKTSGVKVETASLPVQAIVRDKDTWVSGFGGFELRTGQSAG